MTTTAKGRTGKRGNGEGNIKLRADGRWEARVSLEDGRRKSVYGPTRDSVARQMTATLRSVQTGVVVPLGRQSVATFLQEWLETTVKPRCRPRTYESYAGLCRTRIIPALGTKQLSRLTPREIQLFLNATARECSPSMAKHTRDVLRIALGHAVRWRLIPHNPAAATDPPRIERREIHVLGSGDGRAILDAFRGTPLQMPVTLALSLGLRRGEVLGLRWSDVDLDRGILTIRAQLQKVGGTWTFVEPKSKESRRTLPLPVFLIAALREHRTAQLEARLAAGPDWVDLDLVCPSETGSAYDPANLLHRFQAGLKRAGLPVMRVHDLRHGAATMLLSSGATLKEIQAILGHSDLKMTSIYSHVTTELLQVNAQRMHAALG